MGGLLAARSLEFNAWERIVDLSRPLAYLTLTREGDANARNGRGPCLVPQNIG
jgi:hypothetical protein